MHYEYEASYLSSLLTPCLIYSTVLCKLKNVATVVEVIK